MSIPPIDVVMGREEGRGGGSWTGGQTGRRPLLPPLALIIGDISVGEKRGALVDAIGPPLPVMQSME